MFFRFGLACTALALLFSGCSKKATTEVRPVYAFLRFENLTGDPQNDWFSRASTEVLSRSLQGAFAGPVILPTTVGRMVSSSGPRPATVPGISAERSAALSAGANHLIYGHVTLLHGLVVLEAVEEDAGSGKLVRSVSGSGKSLMPALYSLARALAISPKEFITSNEEVLKLYSQAGEMPLSEGIAVLSRVVSMQKDFGLAWVALVAAYRTQGNRDGAEAALQAASQAKLGAHETATLQLEAALLHNDQAQRMAAIRKIADNTFGDTVVLRSLAQQEAAAGESAQAAAIWKMVLEARPDDFSAWNELAYSRAFSGDKTGALDAIRQYSKLRPEDANVLDSEADIRYIFGDFVAAAKGYAAANSKQPDFLNGGELYKGAWATFRAGEQAGADALFKKFQTYREAKKDPLMVLSAADWLFRTGRRPQAIASLEQALQAADPNTKSLISSQLAIWLVIEHQREKASKVMAGSGPVRNAIAATAFLISRPSGSAAAWIGLADKMLPTAQTGSLHDSALGLALMLDGHRAEALPYWKKAMAQNTTLDPLGLAILDCLEGKTPRFVVLPDALQHNYFQAVLEAIQATSR